MDIFLTTLINSSLHEFKLYEEWILGQELALVTAYTYPLLKPALQTFKHIFP